MSNHLIKAAKSYLAYSLSVFPAQAGNKAPSVPAKYQQEGLSVGSWTPYQKQLVAPEDVEGLFSDPKTSALALVAGKVSQGLEVIDVDTKYDLTGTLWQDLRDTIEATDPDLLSRLVIVKTPSGGRHLLYRAPNIQGNLKLAQRPASDSELEQNKKAGPKTIIETRGEGGYVLAVPSPGYELEEGAYEQIPTITPEQRDCLISICRSLTFLEEPPQQLPKEQKAKQSFSLAEGELSPWEDYHNRGDVLELLRSKGWKILKQRGDRVHVLRPGKEDLFRAQSGNYHTAKKTLRVFSSNTEFSTDRAYSPFQVYALLECRGDHKLAARRLRELGYGSPLRAGQAWAPTQMKTEVTRVNTINRVTGQEQTVAKPGETLKVEELSSSSASEVVIISPGPEAYEEILKAIAVAVPSGKRIYIREEEDELRSYSYQLQGLLKKYDNEALTDRSRDTLLGDVVALAESLPALDRDLLLKEFTELTQDSLGITYEAIATETERLVSSRAKDAQQRELDKVLAEAASLNTKGSPSEALGLLEESLKQTRLIAAQDLIPVPRSYENYLESIRQIPTAKKTGYPVLDEFVGFPPGAISLVAGRPSHGKTTLMFNLMLQMSEAYPDESFYFFTYEEPGPNIILKLLNRLAGQSFATYFPHYPGLAKLTNYEFLKAYIQKGATDIPELEAAKQKLRELLDSQRIRVVDKSYSVEDLRKVVSYISEREPLGAVFIDYIQRMKTERRTQDKRTEIAHISDIILQAAKETNLPIILGAQLNRDAASSSTASETKPNSETKKKLPRLEHLKEAGNLEEDANTVLSVYNSSREQEDSGGTSSSRVAELYVQALKNREGEPNSLRKLWLDKHTGVISQDPINTPSGKTGKIYS